MSPPSGQTKRVVYEGQTFKLLALSPIFIADIQGNFYSDFGASLVVAGNAPCRQRASAVVFAQVCSQRFCLPKF